MQYFKKLYFKTILLTFLPLIVSSSKGNAFAGTDLPLPMAVRFNDCLMSETQEFLLTGDSILLIGFLFWIAYIIFFFPRDTLKRL